MAEGGKKGHGYDTRQATQERETSWETEPAGYGAMTRTPPPEEAARSSKGSEKPVVSSVEASAINAMLAQAHLSYLKAQGEGICQAIREEMREGFVGIMKAINDLVRPQLPAFDAEATEEQLLAFDEEAGQAVGMQQGAVPKQAPGVAGNIQAQPNSVLKPARTLFPNAHPNEHRPMDPSASHWRNPVPQQGAFRIEDRRANGFCNEGSERQQEESWQSRPSWVRVEKWDVLFDGDCSKSSVEDFIFRVEFLQHQSRCPWREVLRCFHLLLKGRARDWYWMYVRQHQVDECFSFRGTQTEHDKMHDLMQREQKRGESADDFIHAMQKLASRLREPLPEARLIKIIKKGLRDDLARYIYALEVYSLDQLRDECSEVEKMYGRRNPKPAFDTRPTPRFGVPRGEMSANEIDVSVEQPTLPELEVEEARVLSREPRRTGCWNCGQPDHDFRNCMAKERKIFCYWCGRPDTFCPTCPDCAGNGRKGAMKAGESRQ